MSPSMPLVCVSRWRTLISAVASSRPRRRPGRTSSTVASSDSRPSSISCMIIVAVHTLVMDPIWNSQPCVVPPPVAAFSTPYAARLSRPSAQTPSAAPGTRSCAARSWRRSVQSATALMSACAMARTLVHLVGRPVGPAGAGAPLALVHRLHAGDWDRVAFLDQVAAQLLLGQLAEPRIAFGDQPQRGAHGEVPRLDVVEVLPGHRERHRHARADARAVRGRDGRPARPGRIEEHLARAVLPDEGRGGE